MHGRKPRFTLFVSTANCCAQSRGRTNRRTNDALIGYPILLFGSRKVYFPSSTTDLGMSVQITFEPNGDSGLVAEGTSIWEAARRLGVSLRAECKGRGECDSCAVIINRGGALLSTATSAEEKMLGPERLGQAERLGCQAILLNQGEITLRLAPVAEENSERQNTLRGLPLKEKVGALIELEAVTIIEALNSLRGRYHALIGKVLNLTPETTKEAEQTTKDAKRTKKEGPVSNAERANEQN